MQYISRAVYLIATLAFLSTLDPVNSVGRLHPTHTKTDTLSALAELVFGKFKKSGLTTFVNRLDGAGPILYKTYQRPPQQQAAAAAAGTEGQPGWKPNLNKGNFDLLGIGWKKSGSSPVTATEQPRPGLAGLATRLKNKKIEIQNHLHQKIETKKQFKKNVLGQNLAPGQGQSQSQSQALAAGQVPVGPGSGSSEMQLAPGSAEYERLKQYHLMGVVDMYRPPPGEAVAPTGYGWGWNSDNSAAAPTREKMKPKKKKKKVKKTKKKKQKKIKKKKKIEKKKKKLKQKKMKKQKNKESVSSASFGTGWAGPETNILPAGSVARAPVTTGAVSPILGLNERATTVLGSIGSRVTSTYKLKNRKKSVAPTRKVVKFGQHRFEKPPGRTNSKITRIIEMETGGIPALERRSGSGELPSGNAATFSSRLGLAQDSSASSSAEGISYEDYNDYDKPTQPFYGSYTAFYRIPNYRYSMF